MIKLIDHNNVTLIKVTQFNITHSPIATGTAKGNIRKTVFFQILGNSITSKATNF